MCSNVKHKNISSYTKAVLLYQGILLISTTLNHGDYVKFMGYFISSAGWVILTEYYANKSPKVYLKSLTALFRFNIYTDLILLIIRPNGLMDGTERFTFLGMDNVSMPVILCGLVLFLYTQYTFHKRLRLVTIIDCLVCLVLMLILQSGTGITGMLLIIVLFIAFTVSNKLISFRKCMAIIGVVFVMIIILNYTAIFSVYIQQFLGRDMTFTDRTDVWASAIVMIKENFWIGLGIQDSQNFILALSNGKYKMAHNEYLQAMLNGGIFYCAMLIFILFKSGTYMDIKYKLPLSIPHKIIKAGILGLLTMYISETYASQLILFTLLNIANFDFEERIKSRQMAKVGYNARFSYNSSQ
jgi:hypothetical protein